jgi:hypothetical protein
LFSGTFECGKFSAKKVLKTALIYVCGFIAKILHTKVPGLVRVGEEKTNCFWIDLKSRGSNCFIHPKIYWRKLKNMRKYFKKYIESLWMRT